MYGPIADSTYQVYCSRWRKYNHLLKTTGDKRWEAELTKIEAKILISGREIPKEKTLPSVEEIKHETKKAAETAEVQMYLKCLAAARKDSNEDMAARFLGALKQLGYTGPEVQEGSAA